MMKFIRNIIPFLDRDCPRARLVILSLYYRQSKHRLSGAVKFFSNLFQSPSSIPKVYDDLVQIC